MFLISYNLGVYLLKDEYTAGGSYSRWNEYDYSDNQTMIDNDNAGMNSIGKYKWNKIVLLFLVFSASWGLFIVFFLLFSMSCRIYTFWNPLYQ